jgi:Zn-dependent M28 family amino/carboxypeptidase
MSLLENQTALGPRVPGTEAWRQCQTLIIRNLNANLLTVDTQLFDFDDPYSDQQIQMQNIIGRYRNAGDAPPILLVAHYDSRPRTDFHSDPARRDEPLVGANDGASGVAVLLELGRMLNQDKPKVNVDLLFVDGEDWGKSGDSQYYLLGSNYFATHKGNIRGEYRFAIILDMVGATTQKFYREGYSEQFNKSINDMIWSTATNLGITVFIDSVKSGILDDHMSINVGGVPAVDIIDLNYRHWHTERDTSDKCSGAALKNVGRVIAYILYNKSLWPND